MIAAQGVRIFPESRRNIARKTLLHPFTIRTLHFAFCTLHFALCILLLLFPNASPLFAAEERKVVIPFDFISKFDDGRYGQMMGEMVWKKLSREGGFIIPETMLDVRDFCASHALKPSPTTDLEQMGKIVRDDFDAQIGIWGSVERAPGAESEMYDVTIRCVDFSARPDPKVIYTVAARTNSVSEIPHVYVKQMLDALYERKSTGSSGYDSIAEDNWKNLPNLLVGDFEHGVGGAPNGWERVCGQQREPLGRLVRWTSEEGNPGNKVVRFSFDRNVAENEGVMYFSDFFPIEEGAKYRFQCRWRSKAPAVKVFIKCYDEMGGRYSGASDKRDKDNNNSNYGKRREVYRSQQNISKPTSTWSWKTHTEDFTPKHTKYAPKWGRVMLYAYLAPGDVEFDDVVIKQIVPPMPGGQPKVRRHSTDTKITIEEMEENERRSRDIKAQQEQ